MGWFANYFWVPLHLLPLGLQLGWQGEVLQLSPGAQVCWIDGAGQGRGLSRNFFKLHMGLFEIFFFFALKNQEHTKESSNL